MEALDIDEKILLLSNSSGEIMILNYFNDQILQKITNYEQFPLNLDIVKILPLNSEFTGKKKSK